jgi:FKBP-type peptidyl-prolyl cis-trans isomerase FklB
MKFPLLVAAGAYALGATLSLHAAELDTDTKKASYAIGLTTAQSVTRQGVQLDLESFNLGVKDAVEGTKPRLTQEQFQAALESASKSVNERMKEAARINLEAGKSYREKNKAEPGVTELSSGLQYKELRKGSGAHPKPTDQVVAHYVGTLIDGTEFDNSRKRGEPATLPLDSVIKGWQEAIPLMTVGSRWQIVIPPDLAYGPKGAGPIGPNSTLVFEIELIDIKKK